MGAGALGGERLAIDYDKTKIANTYDAARTYAPEMLQLWLDRFSTYAPKDQVSDILDLGCGTGRHTEALARHFEATVVGLDPSETMLAKAVEKTQDQRVRFQRGEGEALPFEDETFDLILLSMVHHHLKKPEQVARECHRVLRPGGNLLWRNSVRGRVSSYPYSGYFPGIEEIAASRLRPLAEVLEHFESAGFSVQGHEVIDHEMAPSWEEFVHKMSLKADSFVASLSDRAFETGMAALRAENKDGPVTVAVDFIAFSAAR